MIYVVDSSLYYDIQRRGQHIESLAMQTQHLAIHHHVYRLIQVKINAADSAPVGQGMIDMGSIVKRWQVTNQPQAPNRTTADIFD